MMVRPALSTVAGIRRPQLEGHNLLVMLLKVCERVASHEFAASSLVIKIHSRKTLRYQVVFSKY